MRRLSILFFVFLFLSIILVSAFDVDPGLEKKLVGKELPNYAEKIFGNQKINIYINDELSYHVMIESGIITNAGAGGIEKPTMNMYSDELTFQEIQDSDNPSSAFVEAINDGRITYKAVGLFNKFKFVFVNIIMGIRDLFKGDSESGSEVPIYSEQDLQLEDVAIKWEGKFVSDVGWGRATVDPEDILTEFETGYLNMYTDQGWVIQNLYLSRLDGIIPTTYFDIGEIDGELSAYIEVTENPLMEFADGERQIYQVGQVFEVTGGVGAPTEESNSITGKAIVDEGIEGIEDSVNIEDFDNEQAKQDWEERERQKEMEEEEREAREERRSVPRPALGPGEGARGFEPGENWIFTLPNVANVESADMQCVPISVANSLQFLEDTYDIEVPNDHEQGEGGKGSDSLVEVLDTKMNRKVTNRRNGGGTWFQPMLSGKFSYLKENGLEDALVQKHQGRGWGNVTKGERLKDGDFTSDGITSSDEGKTITWEWICEQIQEGEDVELVYSFQNAGGKITGGHAVRVFECGVTQGNPWLGYAHDRDQSDDGVGLETVRQFLTDTDGDGLLNIISNSREVRFVFSESPAEE